MWSVIEMGAAFVGGIFFSAAFPGPAGLVREFVKSRLAKLGAAMRGNPE